MGGGGSQTVTQTNLPSYAKPYFTSLMDRANKLSKEKYQAYDGERIADFNKTQQNAFKNIQNAPDGNPLFGQAMGAYRGAQSAMGRDAKFNSGQISATGTDAQTWNANTASQYMSPYMEQVVDRQKQSAIRDFNRGMSDRNTRAVNAGAFGGSRQAVADYLEQEGLQNRLADIDAQGRQSAWDQAQGQFNQDAGRTLQSDTGDADRYLQAMTANEQARAAAAGVRGNAAGQLASIGSNIQGLGREEVGMQRQYNQDLLEVGNMQQEQRQKDLDVQYSDFVNQRDYDRQTLAWLNSMLRGVPVSSNSNVTTYSPSNPMASLVGLGLGGMGMAQSQA